MSTLIREEVTSVHHWTDSLFSFTATRSPTFRFRSGQFAMIGLEVAGRPLLRAYSMASANHEEHLEFFSIKVQDGPSRRFYLRKRDEGKRHTQALIALARRLVDVIWALLRDGREFHRSPQLTAQVA